MFDPDEFVAGCAQALGEADRVGALRQLLDRTGRAPGAVIDALGQPSTGGLTVLHRAPDLTVLNVVWPPGMTLDPHDHTMLAAIVVYGGREENGFFRRRGDRVEPAGGRTMEAGEVLILGDDAIHSVHGHDDRYTGALHVYAGDFFDRVRTAWLPDGSLDPDPVSPADAFAAAEAAWRRRQEA